MTPPVLPTPPGAPAPTPVITGAALNTRIAHGDQSFPKELWGKTLGEAMRFYAIMREDFMRRNDPAAGGQPVPVAPAAAPPARQPVSNQPLPPAPPAGGGHFDMSAVQSMIETAVSRALGPVRVSQAEAVRHQVRNEFADWQHYEQDILEALGSTPPDVLADPETWRTAYYFAKGRKLSAGGNPAGGHPPVPTHQPTYDPFAPPIVTPPPAPPVTGQPLFVEHPSAPIPNATEAGLSNDPRVLAMSRKFGIPPEELIQWWGGRVPPMNPGGGNV